MCGRFVLKLNFYLLGRLIFKTLCCTGKHLVSRSKELHCIIHKHPLSGHPMKMASGCWRQLLCIIIYSYEEGYLIAKMVALRSVR